MAEMRHVVGPVIDYMARDYESLLKAMRDLIPQKLPEWRDHANEADFGNVLLELFAHMGDILSYYQDRVAHESFLGTARTRRSVIQHLRLIGYELGTAAPATAILRLSVPDTVKDTVVINRGDAFATKSEKNRPSVRYEYAREQELKIDFKNVKAEGGQRTAEIRVDEGRLIRDEVLGAASATSAPNQRFALAHPRLILRPLGPSQVGQRDVILLTQLGDKVDPPWTRRETLAFSKADRDFVVEIDADDRATVVFGDGKFGAIPPPEARITATYRVGGGQLGNVPAGAIQTLVAAPQLAQLGTTVTNPSPATGGAEREGIENAVQHAPAVFHSQHRAVTAADYEALARKVKGVAKVRAVATGWNQVTLFVAPEGIFVEPEPAKGKVSDVLEADLKSFFEDKRMLNQIVEIEDVDYVAIYVTAEIEVESFYVRDDVVSRVQQTAARLLKFADVKFNQPIYLSKFYDESQSVPGVVSVNITEFRRGDRPDPMVDPLGKIELGANEVPVIPAHKDYSAGMHVIVKSQGRL